MLPENKIPECIARYAQKLNNACFYVGSSIPQKKLKNAVRAYGDPGKGIVHALYDCTIFGSAKEGLLFTERSVFYHYFAGRWAVDYADIQRLEIEQIDAGHPDPIADTLHIHTRTNDHKITIHGLDKRHILALLEELCGIGRDGFDVNEYMDPTYRDDGSIATMESAYFKRHRCVYCNSRTVTRDGIVICNSCNRVNRPMAPISILHFQTIPEENLRLLRAKEPGAFTQGIHREILAAADDGRLRIAAAISDGYYSSELRYDSDLTESDQFIKSPDGIPIEGCFYSHPLQEEGCPVWVIRLERSNGRRRYALLGREGYDQLAESMASMESALFPVDEYDPKKRSDGL